MRKVLVAENESIIALDILTILKANSFSVINNARTFNAVEKRIKEHSPDLLITSLSLKNSDDYFDKIINLQKEYNFSVLFLTALSNTSKYEAKCSSSCFGFIKKPFNAKELIESIKLVEQKSAKKK